MEGRRGRGREGFPRLPQAGAVPGTRELLPGSPNVLCPQPALGFLPQPMGQCRATARCHQGWVTFPSPGSPLCVRTDGCLVLPWEKPCQKPLGHEVPPCSARALPCALRWTMLCVICGFPVSLWGACSLCLPPSMGYGGMGTASVQPCTSHTAAWHGWAQRELRAQISQGRLGLHPRWGKHRCCFVLRLGTSPGTIPKAGVRHRGHT